MKKIEYLVSAVPTSEEKREMLSSEKLDDTSLPEFSREVPLASKKYDNGFDTHVDYEWKENNSELIKVKSICFRADEDLQDFYRVNARDGTDSVCVKHNRAVYILRKTKKEVAHALHKVNGKLSGAFAKIIGFLKTVVGNCYTIAKVEGAGWSFDRRLTRSNNINYVDIDNLSDDEKTRLSELISEKIADVHSGSFVIGSFTMNNVLLSENDLKITDLRGLRVSRKRSFAVEEFKSILQYLISVGLAKTKDIYPCVATYIARNEGACTEWYSGKSKKKNADIFEIASCIEQEVYS